MPRDGTQTYVLPFPDVAAGTTIESPVYNGFTNDVAQDLNTPRPIKFGGTGAVDAATARFNLATEIAAQVVTNYDSQLWVPGSFYSATTATGEPVDGHAFSGVAYIGEALANPPTNQNVTLEARDVTDGKLYIRRKVAGVWGAWALDTDLSGTSNKVDKAGDTMTGMLVLPATVPTLATHATNKAYVDSTVTAQTAIDTAQNTAINNRVRYDAAQGLTTDQKIQARANIDALKRNYITNGAMMISQENGSTASSSLAAYYPVDQFFATATGTTGVVSCAQVASFTPAGSPNRIRMTVTTADAAIAAGDLVEIGQIIEGLRIADLRFGSASAKTVTLQFGVKAPQGIYSIALVNSATNRSYVASYTISAGENNSDTVKNVTIPGDTTGTWLSDNGKGFEVRWGLMVGATFQQAASSWGTGNAVGFAGQFNLLGTNGNVFELFDVGLYEGSVAPAFQVPDYATELLTCMRYFQMPVDGTGQYFASMYGYVGTGLVGIYQFIVPMRGSPAITLSAVGDFAVYGGAAALIAVATFTPNVITTKGFRLDVTVASGITNLQASIMLANSANARIKISARL